MEQALRPPPFRFFASAPGALDVDFVGAPTPELVTAVLAACAGAARAEDLWGLPVGVRLQYLIAAVALEGEQALWVQQPCANAACGEQIEIDLAPAELLALAAGQRDDPVSAQVDGQRLDVRRPTGADQLAWLAREFADEDEARRAVVADLVGDARVRIDDELVASVEAALGEADPLVCLDVDVVCPYCGETRSYELDLLEPVLARFRERQHGLFADVHALASHYHWTEDEILAVPPARRARYLALVDRENR